MLNNVTITGRIRRLTEAVPGYAGQRRIYVEADVARDAVNADGTRWVDAIELVVYGKRAEDFDGVAGVGDLVTVSGALRTRYGAPDQSGRRPPITYIDVRRFYPACGEFAARENGGKRAPNCGAVVACETEAARENGEKRAPNCGAFDVRETEAARENGGKRAPNCGAFDACETDRGGRAVPRHAAAAFDAQG